MTCKSCNVIASRVERVREAIESSAARAGRKPEEITLVGVTKTQTAGTVRALLEAGVMDIGENRVQEIIEKSPHLCDLPHKTHLIGHLQRNKAKFLPQQVDVLQSLDSITTIEAIEKVYAEKPERLEVLIEVNIGDETNKNGVCPCDVIPLAERVAASPVLRLRGLMTVPPICTGDLVRRYFEQMYHLFIDIRAKTMDNNSVTILSMGMSSDFQEAILEGSTMVRVGTALFGRRT